jgi:hypothetical protein
MSKIEPTSGNKWPRFGKSTQKQEDAQNVQASSFSGLVKSRKKEQEKVKEARFSAQVSADLEELVDDVHSEGERLKEEPTMENIRRYREAVSAFLQYVVANALEAETSEGARFNPLKKQKRYTMIRVVNEKLEKLASGIMQNQYTQMDILRRVEEINGLIVDIKG